MFREVDEIGRSIRQARASSGWSSTGGDQLPGDVCESMVSMMDTLTELVRSQASAETAWAHPLQRAEVLNIVIQHLDVLVIGLRECRNAHIRQALATGTTPSRVARRMGVSKTYVLRIRDDAARSSATA
jgi:hypothetical protein